MKILRGPSPSRQRRQKGNIIAELLIGSVTLIMGVLVLNQVMTGWAQRSKDSRNVVDIQEALNTRLHAVAAVMNHAGGLHAWARQLSATPAWLNPPLSIDPNASTTFSALFGFPKTDTLSINSVTFSIVTDVALRKTVGTPPTLANFSLGTDHLTDLLGAELTARAAVSGGTAAVSLPPGELKPLTIFVTR
jgi:hypothetical protein